MADKNDGGEKNGNIPGKQPGWNRQAEEALQENAHYFREITDNFSDIIIIADRHGEIKYCSRSVERFLGYKPEELVGKSAFAFIHPDDLQRAAEDFAQAVLTDEDTLFPNTLRITHKNGSVVYLEGLGRNFLNHSEIAGYVMNVRDVTERRKMEEQLKRSEEQYRLLADHMSDYVWLMDSGFRITYISPSLEKLLGRKLDAEGQLLLDEVITPASCKAVRELLSTSTPSTGDDVLNGLLAGLLELEFISKKDRTIWGECKFSLIRNEDGQAIYILGEGRNISKRKQIETALRESEMNFRRSLDESPLGVRISTAAGETIYANRAILDIYGYESVEELKATPIKNRYTPESYAEYQVRKYKRQRGDFGPSEYDINIVRKTGEIRHLHVFRKQIFWSGIKQFHVIYQDITERQQAEEKLKATLENLRQSIKTTIEVLNMASEAKDPYVSGHQKRVANLARAIASEEGLPHDKIEGIRMAGTIHDIGKLSVPAEILSKATRLTNLEFSLVKEHAQIGYDILKNVESPWPLAKIVQQHHERMNGTGYPGRLKGEDILIESRIMAVADVVEAMASHRPYRPALGIDAALDEIRKNRGILYDEDVVDACLTLFEEKGYQLV